ncbi:alpha/beta fold hydrolase [Ilumatobacter sp.]|uniref:alpha/beta fold hydrolase n=1 Tax=Ilumatobacter sp. TaxID=1967498 RepID=UPI003AF578CE
MDETMLSFTAHDGTEVAAYRWTGERDPRGIVQIAHGMGEHAGRYRRLARALTGAGYVVSAGDHRGHGRTAGSVERLGDFGPGGWPGLMADIDQLAGMARGEFPGLPLVMVGHSMGSFALQQYLLDHSTELAGAVLSGTSAIDVIAAGIDPTQEVDLSAFNAPFEPARTDYDWLSRDPDEVDLYIADDFCGFGVDAAGAASMLASLTVCSDAERLAAIRPDLPLYLVSGSADPLAGGGDLIELVAGRYRDAGVADVTVAVYPDARHEVFNETNRDEITSAVVAWVDRVTAGS